MTQYYDDAYSVLVTDGDLTADFTSAVMLCKHYNTMLVQVLIAAASTPAGSLSILGSIDLTNYHPVWMGDNSVHGYLDHATNTYSHTGGYTIAVAGTAASNLTIALTNGMRAYKLFWDRTSGGSATGLDASFTRR